METIEQLRAELAEAQELLAASTDAMRAADYALAVAETVQGLLVDALQGFVSYASLPTVNIGDPKLVSAGRAALAAAGVTP